MPSSYTALNYHVVFSTKNRAPLITSNHAERLYAYVGGIIRDERGKLLASGGMADHVHLLVSLHPQTSLSDIMRIVKSKSSKWTHETFPEHAAFGWQDGYAAFTVSASNVDDVRRYIANQQEHHRKLSFEDELRAFLDRHGVEYDERYVFG
jgi:REP element-mobilizing transposase RayT